MVESKIFDGRLASIETRLDQLISLLNVGRTEPHYLKIVEAADLICKSTHTLYGMVSRGEIPYIKKGNRLYFKEDELRAWIESGRIRFNSTVPFS